MKVGDRLYYPEQKYRKAGYVTIAKIGRKWITLEGNAGSRVDKTSLRGEGWNSPVFYMSEEDWRTKTELENEWRNFTKRVHGMIRPPKGLTMRDLLQAELLIGFEREQP